MFAVYFLCQEVTQTALYPAAAFSALSCWWRQVAGKVPREACWVCSQEMRSRSWWAAGAGGLGRPGAVVGDQSEGTCGL